MSMASETSSFLDWPLRSPPGGALHFSRPKKLKIMAICEFNAGDGSSDEDGKAGSGLVVNGNRVSRLVVEDFV